MPRFARAVGFTLIELLVVIAILGLLFTVLLSQITGATETADVFACETNLKKNLWGSIVNYQAGHTGKLPPGGGTEFLWHLWKNLQPSDANRDTFFCPEANKTVGHAVGETPIDKVDVRELWRTREEFTPDMTDYAFRARKYRRGMTKPTAAIAADKDSLNHANGTICVLYWGGGTKLYRQMNLEELGVWDADDPDFTLAVGPGCGIPELEKLSID